MVKHDTVIQDKNVAPAAAAAAAPVAGRKRKAQTAALPADVEPITVPVPVEDVAAAAVVTSTAVVDEAAAAAAAVSVSVSIPTETVPATTAITTPAPVQSAIVKSAEFGTKLNQFLTMGLELKQDYKNLDKAVKLEVKLAQKHMNKKAKKNAAAAATNGGSDSSSSSTATTTVPHNPSGFVAPTPISDELCDFLGKERGILMSRTEVSKAITMYIRRHSLQNKENGRIINQDEKLSNLLKLKETDKLSYFNLQRYLKDHFLQTEKAKAKASKKAADVAAAAAAAIAAAAAVTATD